MSTRSPWPHRLGLSDELGRFQWRKQSGRRAGRSLLVTVALAATTLLAPLPPVGAKDKQAQVTSIASGLRNPRGISWNHRALYVAEAGKGGPGPCVEGEQGEACFGRTGAITRIRGGNQERIAGGLPSIAAPNGMFAIGPHDVAKDDGKLYVTVGLEGNLEKRTALGSDARALGRLLRIRPHQSRDWLADLAGYEDDVNPDGGEVDSNPYGLLRRGDSTIATDAGGNSLLRVRNRTVTTLAVFADRMVSFNGDRVPMQAVPTAVVRGPDGAYYVGQLTGFPFPVGGARVYRVVPGHKPQVYARGFTNIIRHRIRSARPALRARDGSQRLVERPALRRAPACQQGWFEDDVA